MSLLWHAAAAFISRGVDI